jgi:hypothetical protein
VKYQRELAWGVGYIQIYIQYFGLAVLLVGGLGGILRWASRVTVLRWACRILAAIALGCTFFAAFSHSGVVADYINRRWRYPREVLAVALADQARLRLPSRVELRVDRSYLQRWENFFFLFQHSGWRGRFLTAMETVEDNDPRVERLGVKYPAVIDKTDMVLVLFSDSPSSAGHAPNGKATLYVLGKDRHKLDLAFVLLGPAPGRIVLRDRPTYSAQGWVYKRIDISQADLPEQYAIGLF